MSGKSDKPSIDVAYVAETGTKSLEAMAELHNRMFSDAVTFNTKLVEFAQRRLAVDLETTGRLSKCKTLSEAVDVMGDFYQQAVQEYAEETSTLLKLGERTALDATGDPGYRPKR